MPEVVSPPVVLLVATVAGYLLGAIPFGVVIARLFGLGDLRRIGSGNIGATNVLRTGNKLAAALTLILDAGKGGAAVVIARAFGGEDAAQIAGAAAFVGHLFPVWLGFRGGKGVATWLGVLLALSFPLGAFACGAWLFTAFVFRYSSLAALAAAALTPIAAWVFEIGAGRSAALVALVLAALIWQRHAANISRLLSGQEPKIGAKKGALP